MSNAYPAPVDRLLTCGASRNLSNNWPDYLELGLTSAHIPALIRMATDDDLHWADQDSQAVWAPMHAWRALGQLRAEAAVEPLVGLLQELEDDDWCREEMPTVLGMIGPAAIPSLEQYLADASHGLYPRSTAAHALERIGTLHHEARRQCVAVLTRQLERFPANGPELNGFLIGYLVDLHATESLPTIKRAFEQDCVDCTIGGDFQDIQVELGLLPHRLTPPTYPTLYEKYFGALEDPETSTSQVRRQVPKIGRNDPCPCGSGKKYKKCCLNQQG